MLMQRPPTQGSASSSRHSSLSAATRGDDCLGDPECVPLRSRVCPRQCPWPSWPPLTEGARGAWQRNPRYTPPIPREMSRLGRGLTNTLQVLRLIEVAIRAVAGVARDFVHTDPSLAHLGAEEGTLVHICAGAGRVQSGKGAERQPLPPQGLPCPGGSTSAPAGTSQPQLRDQLARLVGPHSAPTSTSQFQRNATPTCDGRGACSARSSEAVPVRAEDLVLSWGEEREHQWRLNRGLQQPHKLLGLLPFQEQERVGAV